MFDEVEQDVLPSEGFARVDACSINNGSFIDRQEAVAEEVAVALVFNGISHAVMMATPLDLEDFALGFSLSEGIVDRPADIRSIECRHESQGISVSIEIAESAFHALKQRRRQLTGRSGCGLCGHESLDSAMRPIKRITRDLQLTFDEILGGLERLHELQHLNRSTGGVHAAALIRQNTALLREDVGRHNALDKLLGAMNRQDLGDGFVLMSSRASYELVHKTASANIPVLVTISAPTDLAIRLATEAGLTLIGFARDRRMTVYSHKHRVTQHG